ncbi:hypothetical protein OJE16_05460 [Pantoea tagorei]
MALAMTFSFAFSIASLKTLTRSMAEKKAGDGRGDNKDLRLRAHLLAHNHHAGRRQRQVERENQHRGGDHQPDAGGFILRQPLQQDNVAAHVGHRLQKLKHQQRNRNNAEGGRPTYFATNEVTKIRPKTAIIFSAIIHIEFFSLSFIAALPAPRFAPACAIATPAAASRKRA